VLERLPQVTERVQVLHLGLGAQRGLPDRADRDIGVAPQAPSSMSRRSRPARRACRAGTRRSRGVAERKSGSLTISMSGTPARL
jgi:hypothetical protein